MHLPVLNTLTEIYTKLCLYWVTRKIRNLYSRLPHFVQKFSVTRPAFARVDMSCRPTVPPPINKYRILTIT